MAEGGQPGELERDITELLERIAHGEGSFASGSTSALAASLAAALTSMAARASRPRWADAGGAIAQAEALRARLFPRMRSCALAYGRARTLLAVSGLDREHLGAAVPWAPLVRSPEQRDQELTEALRAAAVEPLLIAEAAAEVAEVASWVALEGSADHRADAVGAAMLAEAATAAAAHLVEENMNVRHGDELAIRARAAVECARAARARADALDQPGSQPSW